jgi:hypothetical protein
METITFKASKKKTKVIKQLLKALDINFQSEDEKVEYNPDFVEKISKSEKQFENGDFTTIIPSDIWKLS